MAGKLQWALEISGVDKAAQQLRDLDKLASSPVGAKGIKNADFSGASDTFKRLNPGFQEMFSKATKAGVQDGLKKAISQPPPIPVPAWKNILAGALGMASGNQYLSARSFMAAGIFGSSGGSGGGRGLGMMGMLGGAGGNFLPAAAALLAVKVAAEALRFAFTQLTEAVQRGAKLYQDAARVGRPVGQVFQLQQALQAVGISGAVADQLLLQAQFARSGRTGGGNFARNSGIGGSNTTMSSFEGMMLGARNRAQQLGELQQLKNLGDDAKKAWEDAAVDAEISAHNAKTLFNVTVATSEFRREWNTLWEQFAATFAQPMTRLIEGMTQFAKITNWWYDKVGKYIVQTAALALPFGSVWGGPTRNGGASNFTQALSGAANLGSVNQFQRMGFIMNGGPNEQITTLREIAANTGLTAKAVMMMTKFAAAGNPLSAAGAFANMP